MVEVCTINVFQLIKVALRKIKLSQFSEALRFCFRKTNSIELTTVGLSLQISPEDIVIDCGANVGDITSKFARSGAMVYAFEPNSICFKIIKRRFCKVKNVKCFNVGVMDRNCVLSLATPDPHAGFDSIQTTVSSSFQTKVLQSREYSVKLASVECIDLDDFIVKLGSRVRLVKIDIEGSEIAVLNRLLDTGAIDLIDHLVVETHEQQMPELLNQTIELRTRIEAMGLSKKICLEWQ